MGMKVEITRNDLEAHLNSVLDIKKFLDNCPNGLQIEGEDSIRKIAFCVSVTIHSIQKAIELKADTMICHHGLFWNFQGAKPLIGPFFSRIKKIVKHDMNLFAYHLPLDAHLELGNAASLAKLLGARELFPFGKYKGMTTGVKFNFDRPLSSEDLVLKLKTVLHHPIMHSKPDENRSIKSLGIVTGGANNGWIDAYEEGLDGFLTGEMSEHNWHDAKEHGVHMFAGGHHATERFGVLSLKKHLEEKFHLECFFIDSNNPA
jgi:dinuclear metal center YbgI/SA1388 family protein